MPTAGSLRSPAVTYYWAASPPCHAGFAVQRDNNNKQTFHFQQNNKKNHDQTQRKNRIRAGRHGFLDVLEAVRRLPDDFLYRCVRASGGNGGDDVPRHPRVGLGVRPRHRHHRRPHIEPLGQVPPLPALPRRSVRAHRHTYVLYPSLRRGGQAGLRLHHLLADDDGLFGHQRALRIAAGRDEPRPEGARHALDVPHDVRLHRQLHRPLAVYAHGERLQRA